MENITTITSDFEYVRLQLLIWRKNGLQFPTKLQADAGDALESIIGNGNEVPLIINCSKVNSISNYSLEPVAEKVKESNREVLFIYCSQIGEELRKWFPNFNSIAIDTYAKTYFRSQDNDEEKESILFNVEGDAKELSIEATDDELKRIKQSVSKSFDEEDECIRLKSTPILTNGVFNARNIISKPNLFMCTCLLLNEKVSLALNDSKPINARLLAVSLRASAFAGVIGQLNNIYVEIIDHMGPKYKLLENSKLSFEEQGFEYFFIGDFLIGGTEMKIANTYAHFKASKIVDSIFIAALLPPTEYSSEINIQLLFEEALNVINTSAEYKLF